MFNNSVKSLLTATVLIAVGCDSAKNLTKQGDKLFYQKGEYENAIQAYKKAAEKDGDKAYLNAKIAESYRLSNRIGAAEPFYAAAIEAGNKADSLAFSYGYSLKANGKYDQAASQFASYAKTGASSARVKAAKREVENMPAVKALVSKKTQFEVSNLDALNTEAAEFSPFIMDKSLYFTSNRESSKVYGATGTGFTDLYVWKFEGADVANGKTEMLGGALSLSGVNDGSASLSRDGKTMVFARGNDGSKKGAKNVDLFISYYKDGKWSEPQLLPFNSPTAWDACPFLSADGKTLFFASDRPGGEGASDLYRVTRDNSGNWGKVANLGKQINTDGEEMFPYLSDDGKLYFSSTGHPGLGGLDIFAATIAGKDATIENLGSPINSMADDFGISFSSPVQGYFASNRSGGKGDDDIYMFKNIKDEVKIVKFALSGVTQEREENGNIKVLPNTHVVLLDQATGEKIAEQISDDQGKFAFNMDASKNYTFLADREAYLTLRENFSTYGKQPPQDQLTEKETTIDLTNNLVLEKIKVEKAIVLDNIYYDFNKWDITEAAALELDKLVQILEDNPTITIELSSHTDQRGKADYNQTLSQKRAESAVTYIVGRGINKDRITAKGYGLTRPLIENPETEEDFQKNRRTEFKITKIK